MFTIAFAPRYRDTSLGQALPAGQRDVAIIRVIAISLTALNLPETTRARGTAAFPMRWLSTGAFAIAAFLGRRTAPGREATHLANRRIFSRARPHNSELNDREEDSTAQKSGKAHPDAGKPNPWPEPIPPAYQVALHRTKFGYRLALSHERSTALCSGQMLAPMRSTKVRSTP